MIDTTAQKLCNCGCGEPTKPARQSNTKRGHVKGEPMGWLPRHGARGSVRTPEQRARYAASKTGENNPQWKGDDAGCAAIHTWINKHYPKRGVCEWCNKVGKTDYANVGHTYHRTREGWLELCRKCHFAQDQRMRHRRKVA